MYFDERENLVNLFDEVKKWNNEVNVNVDNITVNSIRGEKLYSAKEGLNKGNMFVSEYIPYNNHIYRVSVTGKKDELLLLIQELAFKMNDLNLYLDINSNDAEMYKEYKDTEKELEKYKSVYEKEYGPLCAYKTEYYDKYEWLDGNFPWNIGGKKNV